MALVRVERLQNLGGESVLVVPEASDARRDDGNRLFPQLVGFVYGSAGEFHRTEPRIKRVGRHPGSVEKKYLGTVLEDYLGVLGVVLSLQSLWNLVVLQKLEIGNQGGFLQPLQLVTGDEQSDSWVLYGRHPQPGDYGIGFSSSRRSTVAYRRNLGPSQKESECLLLLFVPVRVEFKFECHCPHDTRKKKNAIRFDSA